MEYERINPRNMIFEYMVPSSCWTENADSHYLLIDLPGFKKEEVRIRVDIHNHVIVSGERQVNDNKIIHFEQSFKVPESCNIEETSGILEDEIFYVTMPKKVSPENEVPQVQNSSSVQGNDQNQDCVSDGVENVNSDNNDDYNQNNEGTTKDEEEEEEEKFHRTKSADVSSESSLLEKLSKKLKKNRSLVLTAFIAFSLGVLVSNRHRYQSTAQVERSQ